MTELEAINLMLRAIGQYPVADIPDSGVSDARIAYEVLREYTGELQSDGYDFNHNEKEKLEPDINDEILVPAGTTRIRDAEFGRRVSVREGKLYDHDTSSFTFTNPILVDRVFYVTFENLPQALQRYVVIRSARVFANRVVGAGEQNSYNQEDETRARIAWLNTVAKDMHLNVLSPASHHRPRTYKPSHALARYY